MSQNQSATPSAPPTAGIVNPSEICTIARAQQLGIYTDKEAVYKSDASGNTYTDLRTYNDDLDNQQNRTKTVCKDSLDGSTSSRNCVDQYGPGFVRKLGNIDNGSYVCAAYDCPPGFIKEGGKCKKPLSDAEVDKRSRCDERWYDWFITPNYHLGNGVYSSNIGECFAPCPEFQVPAHATDPVDGSTLDFVSTENLKQCIPRDTYFYGKYKIGSDYCPLAWIHRLNATKDTIAKELTGMYTTFSSSNLTTGAFSKYANNPTHIQENAAYIAKQCSSYFDNIDTPTDVMQNACNALNTPERVEQAHKWCAELYDNEEEYRERIIRESGDSVHVDRKIGMMKQACNAVFCNDNDTALGFITEDQVCFPPPPDIDPATGEVIPDEDKPDPDAPTPVKEQNFVKKSIQWFIYIIIVPALLLIAWYVYTKFIYPRIVKPIWLAIERLLGKDPEVQAYEQAAYKRYQEKADAAGRARLTKN
jgi:hypothetical protein